MEAEVINDIKIIFNNNYLQIDRNYKRYSTDIVELRRNI